MTSLVCSVDMGTTSIKAGLFDELGRATGLVSRPVAPTFVDPAGLEFHADAQWHLTAGAIEELLTRYLPSGAAVEAVSVTNQRATVVPVSADGRSAGPALSWQDSRSGPASESLAAQVDPVRFVAITGLPPSFLWSASKLVWLQQERPEVWAGAARFVLLHDFILRRLGADDFFCDHSNASLTGLLDLERLDWSGEICDAVGVTHERLPNLVESGRIVGEVTPAAARLTGLPAGTPLVAGGGDQQCAAVGAGVVDPGRAGLCLGTAAVVSRPVATPLPDARGRYFNTVHAAPGRYVMEGIQNSFGSALVWAAAALGCADLDELETLARQSQSGAGGAVFLPHLAGIGSPDFDARAKGGFFGVELSHTRAHLARAAFEGVALEVRRILDAMSAGGRVEELVISGGGARREFVGTLLADLTGRRLTVGTFGESTLLGAALLAWTAMGRFDRIAEAAGALAGRTGRLISPRLAAGERDSVYDGYCRWHRTMQLYNDG